MKVSTKRFYRESKIFLGEGLHFSTKYEMPILEPCTYIPKRIIPFNTCLSTKDTTAGIHFFIDDYQFERVWRLPERYLSLFKKFSCLLSPDFSLYMNVPNPLNIWNTYRNRLLAAWMQKQGLEVIPSVSWAGENSFDYCFEGLPFESTLAISTVGAKRKKNRMYWKRGLHEMISRLSPKTLVIYGDEIDFDYKQIRTLYYTNDIIKKLHYYDNK